MHRTLLITLLLPALLNAEIYMHRDADGNITYSDQPGEDAEAVTLPSTNTTPATQVSEKKDEPARKPKPFTGYALTIDSPADQSIIPNGRAPLTVQVSHDPALREGDTLQLKLDGKIYTTQASTHFTIPSLIRGQHTLQATALSPGGQPLGSSVVHTIFVYYPGAR